MLAAVHESLDLNFKVARCRAPIVREFFPC